MAQEITKHSGGRISVVELSTSRPAFLLHNRNGLTIFEGEATIYEDRAPTSQQRTVLKARAEQLKAALAPSVDAQATKAMLAMLASMPAQGGDQETVKLRGEAYRYALDDMPAWAIERMAKKVIRGESKADRRFAPTPPEFREIVSDSLAEIRNELALIEDILRAKVIPAPEPLYRLPKPGALKYAEVAGERVGASNEWSSPFTPELIDDLRKRKERRESSHDTGKAA